MKYAALLTLLSFALSGPVMAKPHSHHHFHHHHHDAARASHHHEVGRASRHHEAAHTSRHRETARASHHADHHTRAPQHADRETAHTSHSGITCEMVRAYVAKVGMGQAIAMAKSAGISAAEEERARQCLAKKI